MVAAGGDIIETSKAPEALGPYSQAVRAGSILYISGQIGLDPQTQKFAGDDVEAQTEQVRTVSGTHNYCAAVAPPVNMQ